MSPDRTAADAHLAEVEAEQAALRRIAALVARSMPAAEVFDAVGDEVRSLMGVDAAALARYEADETATLLAVSAEADARVTSPGDKLSTEGCSSTQIPRCARQRSGRGGNRLVKPLAAEGSPVEESASCPTTTRASLLPSSLTRSSMKS